METHAFGFRLRANAPEAKSDFLSVPEGLKAAISYQWIKIAGPASGPGQQQ